MLSLFCSILATQIMGVQHALVDRPPVSTHGKPFKGRVSFGWNLRNIYVYILYNIYIIFVYLSASYPHCSWFYTPNLDGSSKSPLINHWLESSWFKSTEFPWYPQDVAFASVKTHHFPMAFCGPGGSNSNFPRPGEGGEGGEGVGLGCGRDSGTLRELQSGAGGEDPAPQWRFCHEDLGVTLW